MVILNTLYLKDLWNNIGYDLNYTSNEYGFKNIDNSITKSKFLSGYYNQGRVYNEETFSHFYTKTNANFKLKFIVPNEGYSIYDVFTKENIMKVTQMKDYNTFDHENKLQYQTKVIFPEYETSCDKVINELLKERFGIVDLFTEGVCDCSRNTLSLSLFFFFKEHCCCSLELTFGCLDQLIFTQGRRGLSLNL